MVLHPITDQDPPKCARGRVTVIPGGLTPTYRLHSALRERPSQFSALRLLTPWLLQPIRKWRLAVTRHFGRSNVCPCLRSTTGHDLVTPMANPRITVITPSYNQARFLERTICSVLDQGYDNLEYIVIDGGSTDESVDIIGLYDRELAFWASTPDGGPCDAINDALTRATGDIVSILDGDDVFPPGVLDRVARLGHRRDGPTWIVGSCLRIDESDDSLGTIEPHSPKSLASFLMHESGVLPAPSTFFNRNLLIDNGGFDSRLDYAFHYEYCCRLLSRGLRPTIEPTPLAARREHPGSRSARCTLQHGQETVDAAFRYVEALPMKQRHELWLNCDSRRRSYALAEAEAAGGQAKRFMLSELIRHPWWLADDLIRQTLMHGVPHERAAA